jgi:hypothetical protein
LPQLKARQESEKKYRNKKGMDMDNRGLKNREIFLGSHLDG